MNTIMIQVADRQWTSQALHIACQMKHDTPTQVVLVRMIYVQHPGWLGTDMIDVAPADSEMQDLYDFAEIAHSYGVELSIRHMHYTSLTGALVDAADALNASVVFAQVARTTPSLWNKMQRWTLERQLKARQRQLFTLDHPTSIENWSPGIPVKTAD